MENGPGNGLEKRKKRRIQFIALVVKLLIILLGYRLLHDVMGLDADALVQADVSLRVKVKFLTVVGAGALFVLFFPVPTTSIREVGEKALEKYTFMLKPYFTEKSLRQKMGLALAFADAGKFDTGEYNLAEALALCTVPEEKGIVFYWRMLCAKYRDDMRTAIAHGEEAVRYRPDFVPAWLLLADCCLEINKNTRALECLDKVRECRPELPELYRLTCKACLNQGRYEDALLCAQEYEERYPGSIEASAHMAAVAHRCGRQDLALSRLRKCRAEHYEGYDQLERLVRGKR